jgi:Family of unknown function (DUF6065)
MKIKAYRVSEPNLPIVPPARSRQWQDEAGGGSYRCLPLVMSNQLGLHICTDRYVSAYWTGGNGLTDIVVVNGGSLAVSHFGLGILTFHVSYLLRTPPDWNLLVGGPVNWPKRGIVPLEGLVETDHAAQTFTANFKFTDPVRLVEWLVGDPICRILPYPRLKESFETEMLEDSDLPEEELRRLEDWRQSRADWLEEKHPPHEWQKTYVKEAKQVCPHRSKS